MLRTRIMSGGVAALASVLLLAACGGGSDDKASSSETASSSNTTAAASSSGSGAPSSASGTKVTATQWAGGVCTALSAWLKDVQTKTGELSSDVSGVTDLAAGKAKLSSLVDGLVATTDDLVKGIDGAGVPKVDKGDQLAKDFVAAFTPLRDAFVGLKAQVDGLPTDDVSAFASAAAGIGTTASSQIDSFGSKLGDLQKKYSDKAIDEAFNTAEPCKAMSGG